MPATRSPLSDPLSDPPRVSTAPDRCGQLRMRAVCAHAHMRASPLAATHNTHVPRGARPSACAAAASSAIHTPMVTDGTVQYPRTVQAA